MNFADEEREWACPLPHCHERFTSYAARVAHKHAVTSAPETENQKLRETLATLAKKAALYFEWSEAEYAGNKALSEDLQKAIVEAWKVLE